MNRKFKDNARALIVAISICLIHSPNTHALLMDKPPNLIAHCDPATEAALPEACRDATLSGTCTATDTLHDAIIGSVAGSIVYGATAIACGIACFYPPAQGACTAAGILAGGGDAILAQIVKGDADTYVRQTEHNQHVLDYMEVVQGINRAGPYVSMATGAIGGLSGARSTAGRVASCVMMVVGATLSVTKGINADIYHTNMIENDNKIGEVVTHRDTTTCRLPPRVDARAPENRGDGTAVDPASAGPLGISRLGNPTGPNTTPQSRNFANVISGASRAMANDKFPAVRDAALSNLKSSLAEVQNATGMTPDQLMNAMNSGASVTDLLSKAISDSGAQNLFKDMNANKSKIFASLDGSMRGKSAIMESYASVSRGGAKGAQPFVMPDFAALFGKKGGKGSGGEDGLGSASNVAFSNGRDNGTDIWHSKSNKSIFEIVSDRFTTVVQRFRSEDSASRNEMAFGVPTQTAPLTPTGNTTGQTNLRTPASTSSPAATGAGTSNPTPSSQR